MRLAALLLVCTLIVLSVVFKGCSAEEAPHSLRVFTGSKDCNTTIYLDITPQGSKGGDFIGIKAK